MHSGAWKNAEVSLPLSHTCQQFGCLVYFGCRRKKKGAFQSKRKKESLIRLAAALWTKLLSADALLLKPAWVMSSDALQSWENNRDRKINKKQKKGWKVPGLIQAKLTKASYKNIHIWKLSFLSVFFYLQLISKKGMLLMAPCTCYFMHFKGLARLWKFKDNSSKETLCVWGRRIIYLAKFSCCYT